MGATAVPALPYRCQRCGGGRARWELGSQDPARAHWALLHSAAGWVIFNPACPTGSRGGVRGEEFGECGNLEEDVPSRREWHGPDESQGKGQGTGHVGTGMAVRVQPWAWCEAGWVREMLALHAGH